MQASLARRQVSSVQSAQENTPVTSLSHRTLSVYHKYNYRKTDVHQKGMIFSGFERMARYSSIFRIRSYARYFILVSGNGDGRRIVVFDLPFPSCFFFRNIAKVESTTDGYVNAITGHIKLILSQHVTRVVWTRTNKKQCIHACKSTSQWQQQLCGFLRGHLLVLW